MWERKKYFKPKLWRVKVTLWRVGKVNSSIKLKPTVKLKWIKTWSWWRKEGKEDKDAKHSPSLQNRTKTEHKKHEMDCFDLCYKFTCSIKTVNHVLGRKQETQQFIEGGGRGLERLLGSEYQFSLTVKLAINLPNKKEHDNMSRGLHACTVHRYNGMSPVILLGLTEFFRVLGHCTSCFRKAEHYSKNRFGKNEVGKCLVPSEVSEDYQTKATLKLNYNCSKLIDIGHYLLHRWTHTCRWHCNLDSCIL